MDNLERGSNMSVSHLQYLSRWKTNGSNVYKRRQTISIVTLATKYKQLFNFIVLVSSVLDYSLDLCARSHNSTTNGKMTPCREIALYTDLFIHVRT